MTNFLKNILPVLLAAAVLVGCQSPSTAKTDSDKPTHKVTYSLSSGATLSDGQSLPAEASFAEGSTVTVSSILPVKANSTFQYWSVENGGAKQEATKAGVGRAAVKAGDSVYRSGTFEMGTFDITLSPVFQTETLPPATPAGAHN